MLLNKEHPLASVRDSFNAVFVHGDAVDDAMFYGRGAGELPTASAVMEISLMLPEILSMDAMAESVVHVIEKHQSKV